MKKKGQPARVAVTALVLSAAGFAAWVASEGTCLTPCIPTKGDVPTIGHGSTRYENGTPVRMTDAPISRKRAAELARNLHSEEEKRFRASLPGVDLTQGEYDLYLDFTGQYGIANWRASSIRRNLMRGDYAAACNSLLRYRYAAGFDCSTPGNKRCPGVWTRQKERHDKCIAEQQ